MARRPATIVEQRFTGPLADRLAGPQSANDVGVHWLGQAGFVIGAAGRRLLVDPYLSDTLADKYRGTETPHERLMPASVSIEGLGAIDIVLVTHHHTDHMDPGTLAPLARHHPDLRFVVPRAARAEAIRRAAVSADRLLLVEAGDRLEPWPGLTIVAVRAAHETLERDAAGDHRFLGYGLVFGTGEDTVTLLHTGDTIPFDGQVEELAALRPDLLLLPVNGRSADLAARGIAGNLTLEEAIRLTLDTETPAMLAHHHGLFAFNTFPLAILEQQAEAPGLPIRLIPAREGLEVTVRPT